MNSRDLLYGNALMTSNTAEAGRLLLRLTMGLALALAHGINKVPPSDGFVGMVGGLGFPVPLFFAWLSAIAETAGGFLLAAGLLTRPAALLIVGNFVVIYFVARGDASFVDREKELLFLMGSLFFLLAGAGRFSIDAVLNRRRR